MTAYGYSFGSMPIISTCDLYFSLSYTPLIICAQMASPKPLMSNLVKSSDKAYPSLYTHLGLQHMACVKEPVIIFSLPHLQRSGNNSAYSFGITPSSFAFFTVMYVSNAPYVFFNSLNSISFQPHNFCR